MNGYMQVQALDESVKHCSFPTNVKTALDESVKHCSFPTLLAEREFCNSGRQLPWWMQVATFTL